MLSELQDVIEVNPSVTLPSFHTQYHPQLPLAKSD